jgi:hypothetical protein
MADEFFDDAADCLLLLTVDAVECKAISLLP